MNSKEDRHISPGEQEEPKREEDPLKPDFTDGVALFIAAVQILAPGILVMIGSMFLVYLLLLLLAR